MKIDWPTAGRRGKRKEGMGKRRRLSVELLNYFRQSVWCDHSKSSSNIVYREYIPLKREEEKKKKKKTNFKTRLDHRFSLAFQTTYICFLSGE